MKKWIASGVLIALIILFACIKSVWSGFIYFSLAFLGILCILWVVLLTYYYIEDYYKHFDEDFKQYKAEIINDYNIDTIDFEGNIELYIKKYKKSLRLDKFIDICKIVFVIAIFVAIAVIVFK